MLRLLTALIVATAVIGRVEAQQVCVVGTCGAATSLGVPVQFVIGASDIPGMFINWAHTGSSQAFNGTSSPAALDANGYPNISTPTGIIDAALIDNMPTLAQYGRTWEIGWSGTGTIVIFKTGFTVVSDPQGCTGGAIPSSEISGTNCDVILNWTGDPNPYIAFLTSATYSGMSGLFVIRSSDKTAYLAGTILTPEFTSLAKAENPFASRALGLSAPDQLHINSGGWAYRTPSTALAWGLVPVWFPNLWSSSITGTDQYTAAGATDTPGSWTDGEMLQGSFPNPSFDAYDITAAASSGGLVELTLSCATTCETLTTNQNVLVTIAVNQSFGETLGAPKVYAVTVIDSTHVTLQGSTYTAEWLGTGHVSTTSINIAGRGAKFIQPMRGTVGSACIFTSSAACPGGSNSQFGTLNYDGKLDILFYSPNGVQSGVPFEAQAEIAKEIGSPLWINIDPLWHSSDVTSLVTYLTGQLSELWLEYNDENWNFGLYPSAGWLLQRGYKLGFVGSDQQALISAAGLVIGQDMAAATAAWTHGSSTLHRVNAGSYRGNVTPTEWSTYDFNGSYLCSTCQGTNAAYIASGLPDYNASPNRPKDFTDDYSTASYFQGAQENGDDGSITSYHQLDGIINAATLYCTPSCGTASAGNVATAFAFVDADNKTGTCGGCSGELFTIAARSAVMLSWNALAVSDNKGFVAYEGGNSNFGPDAAFLAGLATPDPNATVDAANIAALQWAYRTSTNFFNLYIYQNQQLSLGSKVISNSNLQVEGFGVNPVPANTQVWAVMPNSYIDAYLGSQPVWQNYCAIELINTGVSC